MGSVLRLLTFNTLYWGDTRARLRALGEILNDSELDLVCLQELVWRRNLAVVRDLAPGFSHVAYRGYGPAVMGGLVTLSKWPIKQQRYVVYRRLAVKHRPDLGWLIRKGLLITRIEMTGHPVTIVNTHLLANFDGDWSPANAYAVGQQAELNQLADELAGIDREVPVIVAGDLNVPRGEWLFDEFLARADLRDLLAGRAEPTYRPTPKVPESQAIDHILVRPSRCHELAGTARLVFQGQVVLAGGRSVYLSDHYGIEAQIECHQR
jgi:endonuclease/exonuclease/phosphatase family metal-dependent hydrolase